jgi:hypothetical protein
VASILPTGPTIDQEQPSSQFLTEEED